MEKELQVVGFRIGRETFGLPIAIVREIVRVPEITSVPNAPDYIEGVINLRGSEGLRIKICATNPIPRTRAIDESPCW